MAEGYSSKFFHSPLDDSEAEELNNQVPKDSSAETPGVSNPRGTGQQAPKDKHKEMKHKRKNPRPETKRKNKNGKKKRASAEEPPESTSSADRFLKSDYESDGLPEPTRKQQRKKKETPGGAKARNEQKQHEYQYKSAGARAEASKASQAASQILYSNMYAEWSNQCTKFFTDTVAPFPSPPTYGCARTKCIHGEHLRACHHELNKTLKGSASYSLAFLKRERLRWHPDRFSRRVEFQNHAQEMFQLIGRIIDGDRRERL